MKTVVINRAKWAIPRQVRGGWASALNRENGQRCCLGFLGKSCGISDAAMRDRHMPSDVQTRLWPKVLMGNAGDALDSSPYEVDGFSPWAGIFAVINDEAYIDDATREAWVREGFRRILKRRVRFVGKYAVKEPKNV